MKFSKFDREFITEGISLFSIVSSKLCYDLIVKWTEVLHIFLQLLQFWEKRKSFIININALWH